MYPKWFYRVPLYQVRKSALDIGSWPVSNALFLPVTHGTLPFIRGLLSVAADDYFLEGTEPEKEAAIQTLLEQASEPALTTEQICEVVSPWGAEFRTLDGVLLEERQLESYPPPPWVFRIELRDGLYYLQFRSA